MRKVLLVLFPTNSTAFYTDGSAIPLADARASFHGFAPPVLPSSPHEK
jgi:hypothetical protein